MVHDPRASETHNRLSTLDLLRFIAASAVMLYHFLYSQTPSEFPLPVAQAIVRHGHLGVEVFFVISGFVVLWSAVGRTPTGFVRARILRLYPEFWLAVLFSAAVFTIVEQRLAPIPNIATVLSNLSMVPQLLDQPYVDGVYWTLFVEIKFYFLLWLLMAARQLPRIEWWLVGWVAACAVGTTVGLPGAVHSVIMFPYGIYFASGGLFYLVYSDGWTPRRALALVVALPVAAVAALRGMGGFVEASHITTVARIVTVAVISATFVFFATIKSNTPGTRFARGAALAGALTYPLYLLHNSGKAIFLLGPFVSPANVHTAAAILFSIAVSYLVYRIGTGWIRSQLRQLVDRILAITPFRLQ